MSLWHAVGENDQKMFNRIMEETVIRPLDSGDVYRAMECAAKKGFVLYLEQLAPHASIDACSNALLHAASGGNRECLTPILPYLFHDSKLVSQVFKTCADHSLLVGALLCYPANCDHAGCLEFLAPYVPEETVNYVLGLVAGQCSVDVLKVLLKFGDPKFNHSKALQKAVLANSEHQIDLLYPLSDPPAALQVLQNSIHTQQDWMPLYERVEAQRLNAVLNNEVRSPESSHRVSKI